MKSPMTKVRREEIRAAVAAVTTARPETYAQIDAANVRWQVSSKEFATELLVTLDAAVAEVHRLRDAYELLVGCVGQLDFGETEAEPPRTQRQWIEFVSGINDRVNKLVGDEMAERRSDQEGDES